MSRLLSFFGLERRSTLANPTPELLALFGSVPTAAGMPVNAETALRSPTTLAACRVITEAIGDLPFHLYRRNPNGTRERDTTHPAAQLLAGDWNPWTGGAEGKAGLQLDALLNGAGYALVARVNGVPRELHRLDPLNVTRDTTTAPEPIYRVRQDGIERARNFRDVLFVATPGSIGGRILNLINLAREAISLDLLMAQHQAKLFANGARPGGVFKYGKALSPDALKRLKESFSATMAGGDNSGRTLILEDGMDFMPLMFNSTDAQFLELRRLVIQEIGRAFKVPATLLNDLDRAVWKNVEELLRQFVQTCLMPWAEVWKAALERVLLTPEERATYFIEPVFDDLLRGDITTRFTAYRQAGGGAWLTRNEIRAFDNLPPVPGGDELILQAGQGDGSATTSKPTETDDAA